MIEIHPDQVGGWILQAVKQIVEGHKDFGARDGNSILGLLAEDQDALCQRIEDVVQEVMTTETEYTAEEIEEFIGNFNVLSVVSMDKMKQYFSSFENSGGDWGGIGSSSTGGMKGWDVN
jgi:hypothetical protein